MTKEQMVTIKAFVGSISQYKMTFSGKTGTLHIRIATYVDRAKTNAEFIDWYNKMIKERNSFISEINKQFPELKAMENAKRYQGFINDICVTIQ